MSYRKLHPNLSDLRGDLDLTTGNLFWKIIVFALPIILASLIQLLYTSVDLICVQYFGGGNYSMAAVGGNGSLINLVVNTFVGVSVGANVVAAIYKGAHDQKSAERALSSSLILALGLGVGVAIIGYFGAETFLRWMNTPEEILGLAATYLKIYFLGVPFLIFYNFGAAILRGCGDSMRPLVALIICGAVNVGLNFLFILGFGMRSNGADVTAVALATLISEFLECLFLLYFLTDKKNAFLKIQWKEFRFYKKEAWQVLRNGIPAGAEVLTFSITNVVIQGAANTFGSSTLAGSTASDNIEGYLYAVLEAFAVIICSVVAQNYGANKKENLKKAILYSLGIIAGFGIVLGLVAYLLRYPLIGIFVQPSANLDFDYAAAMAAGADRLAVMGTFAFFCSMMDCFSGFLQGTKHPIVPTLVTLACALLFRLLYVFVFFERIPWLHNIPALYAAYPISWALSCLVYGLLLPHYYKKASKDIEAKLALEMGK
jgi:putative MATE family efflux protein